MNQQQGNPFLQALLGQLGGQFVGLAQTHPEVLELRRQLEQVCTVNKHLTDFLKLLGEEAINKAFRAASLRLHPDKGGNEEEFKELSRLHDWIVEELRKAP